MNGCHNQTFTSFKWFIQTYQPGKDKTLYLKTDSFLLGNIPGCAQAIDGVILANLGGKYE